MTNTQLDNFLEEGKQSPNNPSLFFINKLETNTHRQPKKQDAWAKTKHTQYYSS